MSSYWDAALRAGRGLRGAAEPRPRARFEDDVALADGFDPVETEQIADTPGDNAEMADPPHPQQPTAAVQAAGNASPEMPVSRPQRPAAVLPDRAEFFPLANPRSASDGDRGEPQPPPRADSVAATVTIVQPANNLAAARVDDLADSRAAAALPVPENRIATANVDRPLPVAAEPTPMPAIAAGLVQTTAPQPLVVAAEPVVATEPPEPAQIQPPPGLTITIDSIDIRISPETGAAQSPSRRVQPPVIALQDYLARRGGGGA